MLSFSVITDNLEDPKTVLGDHKMPNINPGVIEVCKHFCWAQVNTETQHILCPCLFSILTVHTESQIQAWACIWGGLIFGRIFGLACKEPIFWRSYIQDFTVFRCQHFLNFITNRRESFTRSVTPILPCLRLFLPLSVRTTALPSL